jgi:hypothetical protein
MPTQSRGHGTLRWRLIPSASVKSMPRFLLIGCVVAVVVARIGAVLHRSGNAPVGILSIGVGIALGAILALITATKHVGTTKRLLLATIALALVTAVAQHAWLYADFRRQWREARKRSPQVAMFRSETPWSAREYFAREATPQRVAIWTIDAALIAGSATAVVWISRKRTGTNSASRPTPTSDP